LSRRRVGCRAAPALASPCRAPTIAALPPPALRVHLALLTVSVLFGASYVFTKQILGTVTPAAWALFRMIAATAITVPLALRLGRRSHRPDRRAILLLALPALFGVVVNQVLFIEGLSRTTPAHSSVICATIPIWTLLCAALVRQERLGPRRLVAVVLALVGVQYLLGLDHLLSGGAALWADDRAGLLGDVLTLLNGWSFAIHLVLLRKVGQRLDPALSMAVMFLWALPLLGAYGLPQTAAADLDAVLRPPLLWCALYVVLFATVVTYFLNTWALRHTHSSTVALYINVQPIVAVALDCALGAPLPGQRFVVALLLVSTALWLQGRGGR
jgi:drug/metabolite transporter (DMT)-like permease